MKDLETFDSFTIHLHANFFDFDGDIFLPLFDLLTINLVDFNIDIVEDTEIFINSYLFEVDILAVRHILKPLSQYVSDITYIN